MSGVEAHRALVCGRERLAAGEANLKRSDAHSFLQAWHESQLRESETWYYPFLSLYTFTMQVHTRDACTVCTT